MYGIFVTRDLMASNHIANVAEQNMKSRSRLSANLWQYVRHVVELFHLIYVRTSVIETDPYRNMSPEKNKQ